MHFLMNERPSVRLLSTSECNDVAGGHSSDPLIIMAGIVGVGFFVFGFFPLVLV